MIKIIREQFTRYDAELHPECNNAKYLEYHVSKISGEIISYGYKQMNGTTYRWIKREEAKP